MERRNNVTKERSKMFLPTVKILRIAVVVMIISIMTTTSMIRTTTAMAATTILQLQNPHEILSPSQRLQVLSELCENENIHEWDVYGDFMMTSYQTKTKNNNNNNSDDNDNNNNNNNNDDDDEEEAPSSSSSSSSSSFLRKFESQIATEFGKDDAVFMPSGVMAQSIALLIHNNNNNNNKNNKQRQQNEEEEEDYCHNNNNKFACHVTSHLLLHEQHGYKELCGLDAVILPTTSTTTSTTTTGFFGQSPLLYQHLREADLRGVSTVILELPHRELGGKLTPYKDIVQMNQHLKSNGIAFHCDGARIFEAAAGYEKSLSELASQFDSVYISFYKGLGGLSGAMLLGPNDFCDEARIWLRRFGGNLYTLMPYVVSAWSGYQNNYFRPKYSSTATTNDSSSSMSFEEKKDKLVRLSKIFAADEYIQQVLTLEPSTPQVNIVHFYLRPSEDICKKVCKDIQDREGICIFQRIRPLEIDDPGLEEGYSCKLEISIGEANGRIPDNIWVEAWKEFCCECLKEMKFFL